MAEKDLINLAKGSGKPKATKKKKVVKKKTTVKKPVVKKATPEELRDEKAKKVVNELLEDSPILTLNKPEENIIELDEKPTTEQPKGVEWLEEQITLLTEKNAELTFNYEKAFQENQNLKAGTSTSAPNDGELKTTVIQLFNELQENHIKLGVDKNGIGNFRIYCPGFLNRLIKFFPFLNDVKRYQ